MKLHGRNYRYFPTIITCVLFFLTSCVNSNSTNTSKQEINPHRAAIEDDHVNQVNNNSELIKSAEQGSAASQHNLAFKYANASGIKKNYAQAFYWYNKAANQGYAKSQGNLGVMYEIGIGINKNLIKAKYWYEKGAEQGNITSQILLARMYRTEGDTNKNYKPALYWYEKAATYGDAGAQYALAAMYTERKGVEEGDPKELYWYTKAANQGHSFAQNALGNLYGSQNNYALAAIWFEKFVNEADPKEYSFSPVATLFYTNTISHAQYQLGLMYYKGQGVAQDYKQAAFWYQKAADQGNANGQYNLGVMYDNGRGVAQDYKQAAFWYQKAADQEDALGQYNLGIMYFKGDGVAQNFVKSYALLNISAANGHDSAVKSRDIILKTMSSKQIEEGQALTRKMLVPGQFLKALNAY
jgi:uncharacterized protein